MNLMGKVWPALLVAATCVWVGQARADVVEGDEYMKRLKIFQTVQPHGETPFGEQVNLYTGELSFRQTDVVVEGNGPTISLVRTTVGPQTEAVPLPASAGNWYLSIPRIETMTGAPLQALPLGPPGQNWTVKSPSDPNRYLRCTHFGRPFPKQPMETRVVEQTGVRVPFPTPNEVGIRQEMRRRCPYLCGHLIGRLAQ